MIELITNTGSRGQETIRGVYSSVIPGPQFVKINGIERKAIVSYKTKNGKSFYSVSDFYATERFYFIVYPNNDSYGYYMGKSFSSKNGRYADQIKINSPDVEFSCASPKQ